MTEQEAIALLNVLQEDCDPVFYDACEMAISALEKQVARPIKVTTKDWCFDWYCTCGEYISNRFQKHCHDCGQKLDWEEQP